MRLAVLVGIVLIVAGAFVLFHGLTFTSKRSVVDLGDFHASVEERHPVPAWVGVGAIAGGVALIAAGLRRHLDRMG